jgi:outer membrane protein TolC
LGLGAKDQSNSVIASSRRNISKDSPVGGWWGRVLIGEQGTERFHSPFKLRIHLELDSEVETNFEILAKVDYVKAAWEENPEIRSAEDAVAKARAGVAAAKTAYIPDITAFARHSYQDGVPFLVHNFGTVGINLNYTLWDFGKRRAAVREHASQLAEAEQNLEHLKERVAVAVERSYNKLERTRSMVNVATQVAQLRQESERLATNQASQGVVLISDVRHATAKLRGKSGTLAGQPRLLAGMGRARAHGRPGSRIGNTMKTQLEIVTLSVGVKHDLNFRYTG